jgi:arylsulfatase
LTFGVAGGAIECGRDGGSPVTPEYAPPFEFTGMIHSVTVDVSGELIKDTEAEVRQIMARQ